LLRRENRSALIILNPIGKILATAGWEEDARRLLGEASRLIQKDEEAVFLWELAETQAMVGDAEGAAQTIQARESIERTAKPGEPPFEDPETPGIDFAAFWAGKRACALAALAECRADQGQNAAAEELVGRALAALPQSEGNELGHDLALFRITRAQAALGEFDASSDRLKAYEESEVERNALERGIAAVARERFLAGDEERGHRLLGFVTDADSRASAVEKAAIGLTRRGEAEAALRWVTQVKDPYARASGLAAIVRGLTETEEERARDIPEVEP
jgi:tetratricopeptide (TPR) repeat protein